MGTCRRCGAELQADARFCVMCGSRVDEAEPHRASTLTGPGLTVAVSAAAICAAIAGGLFVLLRSLL